MSFLLLPSAALQFWFILLLFLRCILICFPFLPWNHLCVLVSFHFVIVSFSLPPNAHIGLGFWNLNLIFSITGLFLCLPPNTQLGCICSLNVFLTPLSSCFLVIFQLFTFSHPFLDVVWFLCHLWLCFFLRFSFSGFVFCSLLEILCWSVPCCSKLMVLFELLRSLYFLFIASFPFSDDFLSFYVRSLSLIMYCGLLVTLVRFCFIFVPLFRFILSELFSQVWSFVFFHILV